MDGKEFKEWRTRLGFNRSQAAEALGLGRNTPQRYEEGETEIPKYIELACVALQTILMPEVPEGFVEVFTANVYDGANDTVRQTPSKRTRQAIAAIGGAVVEDSRQIVRRDELDDEGRYRPVREAAALGPRRSGALGNR